MGGKSPKLLFLFLFFFSFSGAESFCQGFMVRTRQDFGSETLVYLDSKSPTYSVLDDELLQVVYDCTLAFEDRSREKAQAQYVLQVGRSFSKYYSRIQHMADSVLFYSGSPNMTFRNEIYGKANPVLVQDCFYSDFSSSEMTFTGRLVTEDFVYKDDLPETEWTITEETKTILGYQCIKAEGSFRGRNYTVWFSDEIPISAGPWKLRGLPGIILSVEDQGGACSMEAVSVKTGAGKILKADYPYIQVSRKQYQDMQKQFFEKPGVFASQHYSRIKARLVLTNKQNSWPALELLENN